MPTGQLSPSTTASEPTQTLLQIFWDQLKCFYGEGNGNPLQYSCLEIPWVEEPGGLQSMGSLRVGHD